ncbi:MAG: tetratricopeptide repeat protein [bacterium]|nr:tetratricopeptide repeat protein [bacterium]
MKRKILVFLLLLGLWVEVIPGAVLFVSVKRNESGGEPVAGVEIRVAGENLFVTGEDGTIQKELPGLKPGESVRLVVTKTGMVVVNRESLQPNISEHTITPVHIILCKKGQRGEWAVSYYRIKLEEYNSKRYVEETAKIKRLYENDKQKLYEQLKKLTRENRVAKSQIQKLAKELARMDVKDVSDLYREAVKYAQRGELEKAIRVLKDEEIDLEARQARMKLDGAVNAYILKAQLYITQYRFKEVDKYFQKAVALDRGNWRSTAGYAGYLYDQNQFKEALPLYQRSLSLVEDREERSAILHGTGRVYWKTNRFPEAEKVFHEALRIRRDLAKSNPSYGSDVAATLNSLGILYKAITRFPEAEKAHLEALGIRRDLAAANPPVYRSYVAMTLNNLGLLYWKIKRFPDAEKAYLEALNIRRVLAKVNPAAWRPFMAMTLNNLGLLYWKIKRFPDAEKAYREALSIRRGLAKVNPAAYRTYVARTLNNLGILYWETTRFPEAEKAYLEALSIRRALAEANPATWRPYIAMTLSNLGILYRTTARFPEAEKAYLEALSIRKALAEINPAAYRPELANTLNHLGVLSMFTEKYPQAFTFFNKALAIREKLARKNPAAYDLDLCETLIHFGMMIHKNKSATRENREKATTMSTRAIFILNKYPHVPKAQTLWKKIQKF